jgi:DNA adenine methylase
MANPFLKWAGGKRWLVASALLPKPKSFERFVEPFLGSGAVFFSLEPRKALLADINEELILLYRSVRKSPIALHEMMAEHQRKHSKSYYYEIRSRRPFGELERVARFLYLNRTCWNGLYRVNLRGDFNVPIGTKQSVILEDDDFVALSRTLRGARLRCSDFEAIVDQCREGDFLYVDPPYTVQHNYNGFLKYNERIFNWSDQLRLRNALMRAKFRGVAIVVTNADHESIHLLYSKFGGYRQLERHSVLAGDKAKRGRTTEALYLANLG